MDVLVTGGAGFIGSHLVEVLMNKGYRVTVLDNLSSGHKRNLDHILNSKCLKFLLGDCRVHDDVKEALKGVDAVFHFAANPEVRLELTSPEECYEHNIKATYVLLEGIRKSNVETIVFASSSTVYGDATIIPTPENYGPLKPISLYGASKLACEALVSSYCYSFKKRGTIIRLANIVGPRATHGVILDFIKKLKNNPSEIEILGDGTQTKSYLYIGDCVEAIIKAYESAEEPVNIYNVGSEDQISVTDIARIIAGEMGLEDVKLKFTAGVDGGRGWIGDVKKMLLDVSKIKSIGWKPELNSKEAVRQAAKDLIKELLRARRRHEYAQ
ncbi:MAG: NAD-dependent epimerase/dehydratase family protein [Candidatus Bathyarchaeia archaeon]